jgi:hypothetical protein
MMRRIKFWSPPIIIAALLVSGVSAQDNASPSISDSSQVSDSVVSTPFVPSPVAELTAGDVPNDQGGHILVSWQVSSDDASGQISEYKIERATSESGPFESVGSVAGGSGRFDDGGVDDGTNYFYNVVAMPTGDGQGATSATSAAAQSSTQWIHLGRIPLFIPVLLLAGSILWYISQASKGKTFYMRRIAGLEAVNEAVGRATEMGRKIFFIPGIQDMNNVQTIAGTTILGKVAKLAAEYDADLQVPVARAMVMVTAREVVKESYLSAGRPDSYRENSIFYLTDDQFGYAAAIDGMVVREKPATMFYMGCFYAESLILAETGNSIGAIQIAGTAMPAQLPFFVAACDYTLIGEELFAAAAYLSKEPRQLGSLKGQDVGKALFLGLLVIGVTWQTLYLGFGLDSMGDFTRFFVSQ